MSEGRYTVYRCREAIPELGAQPGDILYIEPGHPRVPLEVVREFGHERLRTVRQNLAALELIDGQPLDPPSKHADLSVAVERALAALEEGANLPRERSGEALLGEFSRAARRMRHTRQRLRERINRLHREAGRPCEACGQHFHPRRIDEVTCPACGSRRRRRRRGA